MSKVGKILFTLIIILILVILVWYFATPKPSLSPTTDQNIATEPDGSQASASASLDQDLLEIDSQVDSLDASSVDLDASLNDKPIDQLQ